MGAFAGMGEGCYRIRAQSTPFAGVEAWFGTQVKAGEGSIFAATSRACADAGMVGHMWPRCSATASGGKYPRREETQ